MPVVGVGYGLLPRLVGEAHGTVGVSSAGAATLSLSGAAIGGHDDFDDLTLMLLMLAA